MRSYIGNQHIIGNEEFEELALGIDRDLFLGVQGESREERAARKAAARDILADLIAQGEAGDEIAGWDALYAEALSHTALFLTSSRTRPVLVAGAVEAA